MSARLPERERLQPALLDRLVDEAPGEGKEAADARVINKSQMRQAVLRDLVWLLNSNQPGNIDPRRYPQAHASVLNFGMPPLSGQMASTLDVAHLERAMRQAILTFEPRIIGDTLRVRALEAASILDTHNQVAIEIHGSLWAQPVPLEFLVRTELDLETGQVNVRDAKMG